MPYSNVERHLWGKMDRCVQDVMRRDGVSKKRAIAICHASITKEDDVTTARQRRKQRRDQERQVSAEAVGTNSDPTVLAALALADPESLGDMIMARDMADDNEPDEAPPPDPTESELAEIIAGSPPPEDEDPGEEKGKDYPVAVEVYMPFGGATSWDQFGTNKAAREQMATVSDLTYTFELLVDNVMRSEDIAPDEKGAAIAALAMGYQTRIKALTKGFGGLLHQFKRALTGAGKNDLPDSAFAYIEPGGKKDDSGRTVPRSLRHYPINDDAHIRNALSRAGAAIQAGGNTADVARAALPKIRAAAKRHGIGKPAKKPGAKDSGFNILKGQDGGWRWVGWVTNKWRDRDAFANPKKGGEILTAAAHKEFIAWVDQDPDNRMPQLWIWHTPGTERKARADFIDFADGFVVASGPIEEKEAGELLALDAVYDLGMSHGMFALAIDKENGYIQQYRTFEVTVLPQEFAANPWTAFSTILKEVSDMFTPQKRAALVTALGEEKVAELEGTTEGMAKTLIELGIEHKAIAEPSGKPKADEPAPAPAAKAEEAEPEVVAIVDLVAEKVIKAINPQGLSDMLRGMDARLIRVEQGTAKQLAEAIRPKAGAFVWDKRPTADPANAAKEATPQPEAQAPTGEDWITDAFGAVVAAAAGAPAQ